MAYGKRDIFYTGCDPNKLSKPTQKEVDISKEFNAKILLIKNELSNKEYYVLKRAIIDVIPSDEFYNCSLFSKTSNVDINDILYKERTTFYRDDTKQDIIEIKRSLDKIHDICSK